MTEQLKLLTGRGDTYLLAPTAKAAFDPQSGMLTLRWERGTISGRASIPATLAPKNRRTRAKQERRSDAELLKILRELLSRDVIHLAKGVAPPSRQALGSANGVEKVYKDTRKTFIFARTWKRTFSSAEQRRVREMLSEGSVLAPGRWRDTMVKDMVINKQRYSGYEISREKLVLLPGPVVSSFPRPGERQQEQRQRKAQQKKVRSPRAKQLEW